MNDFIISNISGALYVIVLHTPPPVKKNKYPYLTFYFNLYAMKL